MDHFFTTFRKLEHELAKPRTTFMKSVVWELKKDLRSGSNVQNDSLTRQQVNLLISKEAKRLEKRYKLREETFCGLQVRTLEKKPHKRKSSLLNKIEEENGVGNDADTEDSLTDEDDLFIEIVDRKLQKLKKMRKTKSSRKAQIHRFAYLSHRIERQIPEVFNARQFIRQAEDVLTLRGGEALEAMKRAREACYNPQRVTSDAVIERCVGFAKEYNTRDAKTFDDLMCPTPEPEDF